MDFLLFQLNSFVYPLRLYRGLFLYGNWYLHIYLSFVFCGVSPLHVTFEVILRNIYILMAYKIINIKLQRLN